MCEQFPGPGDPPTEPIPCGGSIACQIAPAGDQDGFTFTVPAGAAVSIAVGGSLNPCWQLFDPNGMQLEQPQCDKINDESGLIAGTHTIVVTQLNNNQATDYVLSMHGVSESFHCGAPLTLPSDTRMDSLTPAGDTDSFNFTATTGQVVNIAVTGDHNPCWRIYGPDGVALLGEKCKADGPIDTPPLAAGVHTIVVYELVGQTSDYTLSVQLVTP